MCGRTTPKEMADKLRYHVAEYNSLVEALNKEGFEVDLRVGGRNTLKNDKLDVYSVLKHCVEKV